MPRVPLRESVPIALDGSGAGTAKTGPLSAREKWYPDSVHLSVSTAVLESHCKVYVGKDTTQSNFRDESLFASSGDSSGTVGADELTVGMYVWAVWTGADANAQAVLTVVGMKDV